MAGLDLGALLLAIAVVAAGAGTMRWIFHRLRLPGVVGEIVFGLALGPSLAGWMFPQVHGALFPDGNLSSLNALSWIGLALFLFLAGLETEWRGTSVRQVAGVAWGGLLLPLGAGLLLSVAVPGWFFAGSGSWSASILLGVALTVSALPVLVRILEDLGAMHGPFGSLGLAAATVDDVVGWALLGVIGGSGTQGSRLLASLMLMIFTAALVALGLRTKRLREALRNAPPAQLFPLMLVCVFASSWWTNAIGLNAVLGPFAVGILAARHPTLQSYATERLGPLTRTILLPIFFVMAGAQADLRLIPDFTALLVVLAVGSLAKIAGCMMGAKLSGLGGRAGLAAGCLLNARGAVGLVVAKVGLDAGLFSPRGYALLVLFVTLTTIAAPLLFRATRAANEQPVPG